MLHLRNRGGVGVCALMAVLAGAPVGVAQAQVGLDAAVIDQLDLGLYSVQRIDVDVDVDSYIRAHLVIDGKPTTLSLFRHSMRSNDMSVQVVGDDGVEQEVAPPPISTYRGTLSGFRGAKVAASVNDQGQIEAWIRMPHEIWAIQPLSDAVPGADPDLHVVYRTSEIIPGDWGCGTVNEVVEHLHHLPGTPYFGGGPKIAEVAFDADFEYYQLNGNSVPNTVADIESIMNAVELIYLNEVNIGYDLGTIIVRTGADPYNSSDPNTLLNQFQAEWTSNQAGVPRDVAHLMTGRDLNGSVIGIAFFNGVCNFNLGYGLSQSMYTGNFAARVALTAHEFGHNWNAQHCDGQGDCAIMCSGIGGCTGILNMFGNQAENQITAYANSVNCLDEGGIGGTVVWNASVTTNDGDDLVEGLETATVTLDADMQPDVDGNAVLGLAATIFNVLGDGGAAQGSIQGWQVLNDLDELTGDLTSTDGVSLFNVNAGQLTAFGPFSDDDPIDVLQFSWAPTSEGEYRVNYTTVTESMVVWEGPLGNEVGVEWVPVEINVNFDVVPGVNCYPDCNGDGQLNILDFVCFQKQFVNGCP